VHRLTKLYLFDATKEGVYGFLVFIKVRKACLHFFTHVISMVEILRSGYYFLIFLGFEVYYFLAHKL
jgi:hypothetical protein